MDAKDQGTTRVWGPGDQPYSVKDSILAYVLYQAWQNFADDGWPCFNEYTPNELAMMGYRGMKPQEAAIQAAKDGNRGTVTYVFKNVDGRVLKIFEDELKVIEEAEGTARERVRQIIDTYAVKAMDYTEMIVRLTVTMIYMRAEFVSMWQKFQPLINLGTSGQRSERTMPNGDKIVEMGGFRYIGAYASRETIERVQR
jgi:hypothetical protein